MTKEATAITRRRFTAYQQDTLRNLEQFKCFGLILSYGNCDILAIRRNLKRERAVWRHISAVLAKEKVWDKVTGIFYQRVAAAVLLYGSKIWCISVTTRCPLDGFCVKVTRRLKSMVLCRVKDK